MGKEALDSFELAYTDGFLEITIGQTPIIIELISSQD